MKHTCHHPYGDRRRGRPSTQDRSCGALRRVFVVLLTSLAILTACTSLDCPLNNMVYTTYVVYNSDGARDTLHDTLTVTTMSLEGYEVTALNLEAGIDSFTLPISYTLDEDVFYFNLRDTTGNEWDDTVSVSKTNTEHFESIDCSPSYFHTLTGVTFTQNAIESIVINDSEVNYDTTKKHFLIYFKAGH